MKSNHGFCLLACTAAALVCSPSARADDWPQWLGPQRDGIWRESGILDRFPAGGPTVRWRTPIGSGYTGPAVTGGKVFVMDRLNSTNGPHQERLLCLNEEDGKVLWAQSYPCKFGIAFPAGPRSTPAVDGGKVYTFGALGHLACWDSATGKPLWSHEVMSEYKAKAPMWGFAGQPLVAGEKVICLAGGENACVIAFNKHTGAELWRALSAREPGYSAPVIIDAGGRQQLIVWEPEALNSLDPETGKLYWTQPCSVKAGMSITTPRRLGEYLLVSSFYNGSILMRLAGDQPKAELVWQGHSDSEMKTDGLHCVFGTPFIEDGCIFGVCSYGQLRCLKLETGERIWETCAPVAGKQVRWGSAFIVKQGKRFFLWNELGDLIIAKLSRQGYEELDRAHLLEPANHDPGRNVVWSHPAFANRRLYARNDKEIICVSLETPGAQTDR